ncbi:GDSL esterase/lipase At1g29660-like [Lycium barbarum]|uniref:GDSL esterase/lipase At1g29660-like n=1 Tax=Lycium barbarum TaxID=112863 RepID=UPI00293E42D4|nr:GDSL esterase/lipase At1g29660-like [Lycium barbarum]
MGYVLSNESWVLKEVYDASQPGPSTKLKKSDPSVVSAECYADLLSKLSSMDAKIESIKDLIASTLFQVDKIRDTTKETGTDVSKLRVKLDDVIKEAVKLSAKLQASVGAMPERLTTPLTEMKDAILYDYLPYGVDFADGPTGRYTNGRNMADLLAEHLGFDHYIPPFASATGDELLQGVNYASGYAGIRNETGSHVGDRIYLGKQLQNHKVTISRIADLLGNAPSAKKYLNKCLFIVGIGNNDYINNFLLPDIYPTSHLYRPSQYAKILIEQYSHQLKV